MSTLTDHYCRKLSLVLPAVFVLAALAQQASADSAALVSSLLEQGVEAGQIQGLDQEGIPRLCGYQSGTEAAYIATALPSQTRGWETIPNVIRTDGVETFQVEVDVNGSVNGVTIDGLSFYITLPSPSPIALLDDGLGEDRIAGDNIYTAGPFRFDTNKTLPTHFGGDSTSPAGLYISDVGRVKVEETDASVTQFLISPDIGFLRADIAATETYVLSPNIVVSSHLINIQTLTHETQRYIRLLGGDIHQLTIGF